MSHSAPTELRSLKRSPNYKYFAPTELKTPNEIPLWLHHLLNRGLRLARQLKRIALPVLRPEDLDTRHLVITNPFEGFEHFLQLQDSQTRQEAVCVCKLIERQILGIVDVKNEQAFGIQRVDHFDGGATSVKVK